MTPPKILTMVERLVDNAMGNAKRGYGVQRYSARHIKREVLYLIDERKMDMPATDEERRAAASVLMLMRRK